MVGAAVAGDGIVGTRIRHCWVGPTRRRCRIFDADGLSPRPMAESLPGTRATVPREPSHLGFPTREPRADDGHRRVLERDAWPGPRMDIGNLKARDKAGHALRKCLENSNGHTLSMVPLSPNVAKLAVAEKLHAKSPTVARKRKHCQPYLTMELTKQPRVPKDTLAAPPSLTSLLLFGSSLSVILAGTMD